MRRTALAIALLLGATALATSGALAHEHYQSDDGQYSIVVGEQNEPVYTYDWTNLDLIVHETEANGTGGPVPGVHETVNATLVSPGGDELSLPIEAQYDEKGRYEFVEDYYLTQPGQYEVRLTGEINGTDVNGTYKLPGPRTSMADRGFPQTTSTLVDLEQTTSDLEAENQNLANRVESLESKVSDLESKLSTLEQTAGSSSGDGSSGADGADQQTAPTVGAFVAIALVGIVALAHTRRG